MIQKCRAYGAGKAEFEFATHPNDLTLLDIPSGGSPDGTGRLPVPPEQKSWRISALLAVRFGDWRLL